MKLEVFAPPATGRSSRKHVSSVMREFCQSVRVSRAASWHERRAGVIYQRGTTPSDRDRRPASEAAHAPRRPVRGPPVPQQRARCRRSPVRVDAGAAQDADDGRPRSLGLGVGEVRAEPSASRSRSAFRFSSSAPAPSAPPGRASAPRARSRAPRGWRWGFAAAVAAASSGPARAGCAPSPRPLFGRRRRRRFPLGRRRRRRAAAAAPPGGPPSAAAPRTRGAAARASRSAGAVGKRRRACLAPRHVDGRAARRARPRRRSGRAPRRRGHRLGRAAVVGLVRVAPARVPRRRRRRGGANRRDGVEHRGVEAARHFRLLCSSPGQVCCCQVCSLCRRSSCRAAPLEARNNAVPAYVFSACSGTVVAFICSADPKSKQLNPARPGRAAAHCSGRFAVLVDAINAKKK